MRNKSSLIKGLIVAVIVSFTLSGCSSIILPHQKNRPDFLPEYLFKSKKQKAKYYKAYDRTLSLFDVKYEEIDVPTRFGPTHIIVSGPKNGQPLVLLHGMDASSTMWYPNIKALSKTHRVYAVDYIMDAGKSVLKTDPLNNQDIVLFYNDVFDQLKLNSVDLIGTSRGGWIAAHLAIQPENRIRRLVLLSPAQVFGWVDFKIFPAMWFKMFPSRKSLAKTMAAFANHPEKIHPYFREQFYIASKYGDSRPQVTKMIPFSDDDLKKLKMPVLFLSGDNDCMNGDKSCEKAKENIAGVSIIRVPDTGHFMNTDQPEIVNKEVVKFLN
ncbi:alpha/beta fold hydrolase [Flavobacterium selenitireducens]|uniref:alpha/beta fold hydrolase n=1 Tax=Flavobacterium selenitireducens TaxID=2722704 RepID=UPI00168B8224|nr:alpha/beta hydrolase [Flavobacterium selenitireducens]MBD3582976.1 alpha/beta hydrolase [Flavobacterium selenitireducens]